MATRWRSTLIVRFLLAFTALAALGHGAAAQGTPTSGWRGLRDSLLQRLTVDQAIRDTFAAQLRATGTITPAVGEHMRAVDSANTAWLKPLIRRLGWPPVVVVGRDGVQAAFLLVQHADHDPAFQAYVLPLLDTAFVQGNIDGQSLAMLTDRVAKTQGRPQRYGTQATIRDGKVTIDPIEDSAHVDARRARMGLPTLATYRRILDSAYARQGGP